MTTAIELHGLTKRFWRCFALRDVSFQVPQGSVCALLGPNGAGKSTAMKMLAGLIKPSSGRAAILGADCQKLRPEDWRKIGYVSENQKLPEWMTLDQLIGYCQPLYPSWDAAFCEKLAAEFDLPRRQKLRSFSRGMKMKAALLVSLAPRPSVLLLDEPFTGLDPLVREELISGLLEWSNQENWSVLISSHDLDEVERLADHLALIHQGGLVLHESVTSLQDRHRMVKGCAATPPSTTLSSWREFRFEQGRFEFVETAYSSDDDLLGRMRGVFPAEGLTFDATPMNLRGIYLTSARQLRLETKEAA